MSASVPNSERRKLLESLDLNSSWSRTCDTFSDGDALLTAVCELGLEGVVAKKRSSRYRPGDRQPCRQQG